MAVSRGTQLLLPIDCHLSTLRTTGRDLGGAAGKRGPAEQHRVAPCDELVRRTEWVSSVFGSASSDHGRNQAWFEFCSQIGELVKMDMVGLPVYSFGCAIGHAIRMASRITGRHEVIIPAATCPERRSVIASYCEPPEMASHIAIRSVGYDPAAGLIDLAERHGGGQARD